MLRHVLAGIVWVAIAAFALVASALHHLDTPGGRDAVCADVESRVDDLIAGDLALECAQVSPWHVRVERVRVVDPGGRQVVGIDALEVRPDLDALLRAELRARSVSIEGPLVDLREPEVLGSAFALLDPSPPSEEPVVLPFLVVDDLSIRGGAVLLPGDWRARRIELDAALRLGPAVDVALDRLEIGAERGEQPVGQATLAGRVDLGGRSDVELDVRVAGDRVAGPLVIVWGEHLEHGPERWEARLEGRVAPELFSRIGLPEAARQLAGPVSMDVRADGTLEEAGGELRLETPGGRARVDARYAGGGITGQVETEGLALTRVLREAPDVRVAGALDLELGAEVAGERPLRVAGRELTYDVYEAPELEIRGALAEDHLSIVSVAAPHLSRGGHLDVAGEVAFDGDVDLRVDAHLPQVARDANVRRLVPGLRSGLRVDGRVRWSEGRLNAGGSATAETLQIAGTAAERVHVEGRVAGRPDRPRTDVRLQATGVRRGGVRVADASLTVVGGPTGAGTGSYAVDGTVREAHGGVDLDLTVATRAGGARIDGELHSNVLWSSPLAARLESVELSSREVRLGKVTVRAREGLDVEASGVVRTRGDNALSFDVRALDLHDLEERVGLDLEVGGALSARGTLNGPLSAPIADAELRVNALTIRGWPAVGLRGEAHLRQTDAGARIEAGAFIEGPLVRLRADGAASLLTSDPAEGWDEARLEATTTIEELNVALAAAPLTDLPLTGSIRGRGRLQGTLSAPDAEVALRGEGITIEEGDPLSVATTAALVGGELRARGAVADGEGELATLDATLEQFDVRSVDVDALMQRPMHAVVTLRPRRLDALPRPWRLDDQKLRVGGVLDVRDDWRAQLRARVQHDPEEVGCAGRLASQARVRADLADERLQVEVRGDVDRRERLVATTAIDAPVAEWLQSGFPERVPPLDVRADARALELSALPVLCHHVTGVAGLAVEARRLFSEEPHLDLRGTIADLSVQGTETLDVRFSGGADRRVVTLEAVARAEDRDALQANAEVPIRWNDDYVPELRDRPWEGRLRLDRMPVTPLLAPVPFIAQPSGALDGDVMLAGVGTDATARGAIELQSVSATLTRPFLRVEDLRGAIRLTDRGVELDEVRYRDRDGELRVNGDVPLEGWTPTGADLVARARQMPMRVDGVTFAIVDAEVDVDATIGEERNDVEVRLSEVAVKVPKSAARRVQTLETHGDVVYVDELGFDAARARAWTPTEHERAPEEEMDAPSAPTHVEIRAEPFWVRRDDFAVQLRTRLEVVVAETVRISGPVQVRRGFIELLGRNFDFQQGEIRFAGGRDVDPRLDLEAVHELRTGETVTVFITGQLSRPALRFATSAPGVESDREILELLVRGRTDSTIQTVQEQATSALAGLMAGFLSSLTRSELGRYIPVFRIESEGANSARVRAGFTADDIIPDFLSGVVEGAYVEGFVGTEQEEGSGSQQVTGGFLIELLFPRSIVGRGTYQQPSNWSIDLTWEPL